MYVYSMCFYFESDRMTAYRKKNGSWIIQVIGSSDVAIQNTWQCVYSDTIFSLFSVFSCVCCEVKSVYIAKILLFPFDYFSWWEANRCNGSIKVHFCLMQQRFFFHLIAYKPKSNFMFGRLPTKLHVNQA